jgi:hypothetical protein
MKKVIIFLLLILLINLKTNAQNTSKWADSSAVWHHKYYQFSYSVPGYQKSTYTIDTIINNKLCQVIYSENQVAWPQASGIPTISPLDYLEKYYFHKSNDSVFIYINGNFHLAFKTNAALGEVWDLGEFYANQGHAYVKVDSVYFQDYNGINLRNIHVFPCRENGDSILFDPSFTDTSLVSQLGLVNEKFGPFDSFLSIMNRWPNNNIKSAILSKKLLCYESFSFSPYQFSNTDCFNGILTATNEKQTTENIYLYPNPANDRIYFSNNTLYNTLNIYNNIGQLQQTFINSNNSGIDISLLSKGFYTYTITDNKQNIIANGKFIKD